MSDDGELNANDVENLSINAKPSGAQSVASDDDEFGEFGEFDGDQNLTDPSNSSAVQDATELFTAEHSEVPVASQTQIDGASSNDPMSGGTKRLVRSSEISKMSFLEIQQLLTPPPNVGNAARDESILEEDSTITSKTLWQHLTETEWIPLPKWEGSSIHRQLVFHLGIPLDLDSVRPEGAGSTLRSLYLPSARSKDEIEGTENIPYWTVAMASEEAINSMDPEDLTAHIAKLEDILQSASAVRDALEAQLMDLDGQRYILNGMVDSWLQFFQSKRINKATPSTKQKTKLNKDWQRKNKEQTLASEKLKLKEEQKKDSQP